MSTNVSARQQYLLNRMNLVARDANLGDMLVAIDVAGGNAAVIAEALTGYASGAGSISSSDSILGGIQKSDGNVKVLQNGTFSPTSETIAAAGACSITKMMSLVNNATGGDYAITLAAPSSQDGQLKMIKLGTATHKATLAMTNIMAPGTYTASGSTTLTFTATGDSAIFIALGAKWVYLGGSAVAS